MDKDSFLELLRGFGLPAENVYEDISEIGCLLWNNSNMSLTIVAAKGMRPMLQLVILRSNNNYAYFNCNLDGVNGLAISGIVEFARKNSDELYAVATTSRGSFNISNIGHTNRVFEFAPFAA